MARVCASATVGLRFVIDPCRVQRQREKKEENIEQRGIEEGVPEPFSTRRCVFTAYIFAFLNLYMVAPVHVANGNSSACTATKIPFLHLQKRQLRGLSPNVHIHVSVSDL